MADHAQRDDAALAPYRLPIAEMPPRARAVHDRGVKRQQFAASGQAAALLLGEPAARREGVYRAADGTALILCDTELPGVTPAMFDWWFGWHLPESARYRLWHPRAHLEARCKEDRSALADDRARYVGNVSYVDEYIGRALQHLAIEFQPPASFGFTDLDALGATAVCARTVDRKMNSEGGSLVHLVLPTGDGSALRSAFWLGNIHSRMPLLGPLLSRLVNRPKTRVRLIPDGFLLDLYQHCAEEMNHLAKFLPRLYGDMHASRR